MRGIPSKFEVKMFLNSIARNYTDLKKTNTPCSFEEIHAKHNETDLKNIWKNPVGSKPPSRQMFQILLQECTLIRKKQKCFVILGKNVTNTIHTWNIIENSSKNLVGSKTPSRLFSYLWCVIIAFYSLSSEKQISEKYQKIHEQKNENTFLGLKPPSRLYFWLLYMICDHCILFLFRQKQILVNSGRTDKTFGKYPKTNY